MTYAFILGREPALSTAEILARFQSLGIGHDPKAATYSPVVMQIDTDQALDAPFFHTLGGSIKMAEVLRTVEGDLEEALFEALSAFERPNIDFGISLYASEAILSSGYRNLARGLRPLALTLKKRLKAAGKSARVVLSEGPALTAVQVDKNGMIEKGAEMLIIVGQGAVQIARTIAVQEYESFGERDFGRPKADAMSGMLPPKLARMMVNIAGVTNDKTVIDPFCGSGTVLTEAADLGYRRLLGSDISEKAVSDSRANADWLLKKLGAASSAIKTFQCDIKDLPDHVPPKSVDAVVSEPYLGPPLRGQESDQKKHHVFLELMGLYRRTFTAFAAVLKPGAVVVFVFPVIDAKHVNLLREFETMGFKAEALLPGKAATMLGLKSPVGLLYQRPDQLVGRDVFRFRFQPPTKA